MNIKNVIIKISLAAVRINARFMQKEIANKRDVSSTTIVNWEIEKIIPKQAQLEMRCRLYNFSANNIFLPIRLT